MKAELAERILTNIMNWDDLGLIHQELEKIQIIAELKYDDYQQYTHGQRFIEKLSMWLRNFETDSNKKLAYDFIKENLIFISEEEMRQLVSVSFEMYMKPFLMTKTKEFCKNRNISDIEERKSVWKYFRRSALFLGLSDGAHMDYFRRHNKCLNNEQVFVHYDLSKEKAVGMENDLKSATDFIKIREKYSNELEAGFNTFFLLDDFSASGKSYIRFDEQAGKWKGKIAKFIEQLDEMKWINIDNNIKVHVILYVATNKAISKILEQISNYKKEKNITIDITVNAVQLVEATEISKASEMFELLQKNYLDNKKKCEEQNKTDYVDEHFKKGDITYPFLGFDACSLTLVLYHNTPNNSLPVIWYSADNDLALFPRITRHKEE